MEVPMRPKRTPKQPPVQQTCAHCGKPFLVRPHIVRRGDGRYCSKSCALFGRPRPSLADRFWSKVDKSGGPDACWPWTARRYPGGYGQFSACRNGKKSCLKAHRVAYTLSRGPIPPGHLVRHYECDYPPCCNPAHLRSGTHLDNSTDMHQKGRRVKPYTRSPERHIRGTQVNTAKLTDEQVREIRRRHAAGDSTRTLANAYGVGILAIQRIVIHKTWTHVSP
jgi:hypothetical protein